MVISTENGFHHKSDFTKKVSTQTISLPISCDISIWLLKTRVIFLLLYSLHRCFLALNWSWIWSNTEALPTSKATPHLIPCLPSEILFTYLVLSMWIIFLKAGKGLGVVWRLMSLSFLTNMVLGLYCPSIRRVLGLCWYWYSIGKVLGPYWGFNITVFDTRRDCILTVFWQHWLSNIGWYTINPLMCSARQFSPALCIKTGQCSVMPCTLQFSVQLTEDLSPEQYTVHCSAHCTLHTAHSTLHSAHCTVQRAVSRCWICLIAAIKGRKEAGGWVSGGRREAACVYTALCSV